MATALLQTYDDPRWMSYKQASDRGWQVRGGEKGTQIEFWEVKAEPKEQRQPESGGGDRSEGEKRGSRLIHRVYTVFNAKQIDYFNGTPVTAPKEVKMSDKPEDMLRFDLENERVTILNYRQRIRQAEAMGEFALSEVLREIIAQEQEHLTDLANALGIDNPKIEG